MKTFLTFLASVPIGGIFSVHFPEENTYSSLLIFTHEDGAIERVSVIGQYGANVAQLTLSLAHKADILKTSGREVNSSDIIRFIKANDDSIYALA